MRRAARWEGAVPLFLSARHGHPPPVDEVRDLVEYDCVVVTVTGGPFEVRPGRFQPD